MWYNYTAHGVNKTIDSVIELNHLESYIQNLPANTTLYHGYYSFEKRDTFKEYSGLLTFTFDTIHIDLDSKDDEGASAWEQTKALCKRLQESGVSFQLYFSGNKGFHVAIHKSALGLNEPMAHDVLSQKIKSFLYGLKLEYPTVDTAIHDPSRKFRAYRSQHEKSKLYKIRLTGIGIKPSELTIDQIRNLALKQPTHKYAHPLHNNSECPWLVALMTNATPAQPHAKKGAVKELTQGTTLEDDSYKYKNFAGKSCVTEMLKGVVLPQFNRHDIELCLATELRLQGKTLSEAEVIMGDWASRVYSGEADREKDSIRQLRDMYKKDLESGKLYQFGCYGDVKKAYCSAKCKIYNNLKPSQRAEPLDCNKTQIKENRIKDNPALELSEGMLADKILTEMPELCKSNGQYFQWITTHWKRIDGELFEDSLLKVCMGMYGNQAPIKKIKALSEHVIAKIPIAPETNHFFASSPNKFNFTDCTAEVVQEKGVLRLVTRPHDQKDYLAYCAPFPLKGEHTLPRGTEFKKYMETRMHDVGEEGIRIIKQMLGAALIPYVPRVFFIEGITNSGKSTLAKLIIKLLGEENVSSVLPVIRRDGGERFKWEPSIGKIANIVLELPKGSELDVNTLKMVRDKTAMDQDRKNRGHVKATLPFLHIYCCNQMPQSFEGNSGALNNRVSMLFFKPGYLNGSSGIVEFAEAIWDDDAGGVLEAAREGLADLVASGFHYFNGNASIEATKQWQKMTDAISLYLEDINKGEWNCPNWEQVEWEKGGRIYSDFKEWCSESGRKAVGKHGFYRELESRFQVPRKCNAKGGERFFMAKVVENRVLNPTIVKSDQNPTVVTSLNY